MRVLLVLLVPVACAIGHLSFQERFSAIHSNHDDSTPPSNVGHRLPLNWRLPPPEYYQRHPKRSGGGRLWWCQWPVSFGTLLIPRRALRT
ncbi:hypothetical protein BO85DRAFT_452353 [Aspergillus piperis CBS 112811]|uniref:Secreted protein n=1 Tax=Aspergillus piperis CBS 112811 TaxID=1448313 RepID=A0A8G1VIJ5_9EURO|nr:hypothetical protein BO85DRAFT_452353 [Aspergillus piperis CBS 112811]RAH54426.1 hypothetical protein BO85DRAFT_452353 [Aspergillus piperis CBS 112811]